LKTVINTLLFWKSEKSIDNQASESKNSEEKQPSTSPQPLKETKGKQPENFIEELKHSHTQGQLKPSQIKKLSKKLEEESEERTAKITEKEIKILKITIANLETELAEKELEIEDFQEQLIILTRKKANSDPFFTTYGKELAVIATVAITAYFLLKWSVNNVKSLYSGIPTYYHFTVLMLFRI